MKQRQKKIRFTCTIMAMLVLWVGMYFRMQEADSLFLCKPDGYSTAALLRIDIPSDEAYLFSEQEITVVREALVRYATAKNTSLIHGECFAFNDLIAKMLSALLFIYFAVIAVLGEPNIGNAVILQFIHSQDGEK